MPKKADYMKIINEKLENRSSKASKPEKEGPAGTGPDMESVSSNVSITEE